MNKIRVNDSIDLFNARQKEQNTKSGKPINEGLITAQDLGKILYKDAQYGTQAVGMNRITKGKIKSIKIEYIDTLCEMLGVDGNFLFGYPSVHDKDFKRLCK